MTALILSSQIISQWLLSFFIFSGQVCPLSAGFCWRRWEGVDEVSSGWMSVPSSQCPPGHWHFLIPSCWLCPGSFSCVPICKKKLLWLSLLLLTAWELFCDSNSIWARELFWGEISVYLGISWCHLLWRPFLGSKSQWSLTIVPCKLGLILFYVLIGSWDQAVRVFILSVLLMSVLSSDSTTWLEIHF